MLNSESSQVPLSHSSGGLGLRSPSLFEPAAKISSLSGKGQWMTRFFPAHYNFNKKLHDIYHSNIINSLNINNNGQNSSNSNGNNSNNDDNKDEHKGDDSSDLVKNVASKIKELDTNFKQLTSLDNPIPKHIIDLATHHHHQLATNNVNELLIQNLNFSQVMIKYRDRVENSIIRFNKVAKHTVTYDPTKHCTHKDLIQLVDQ